MKAAVVDKKGAAPRYADFTQPAPQNGETRIAVTASALSPLARARASGSHYSADGAYPFVAGVDGVGRTQDGRRVYFLLPRAPFGAMSEATVVDQAHCVPVPDEVDDRLAAAIANPGMSSWAALTERARLRSAETVLVNGATGSSGRLAVRIARHLGAARVVATGRNQAVLAGLGADSTITLGQDDATSQAAFAAEFARGVDVVLDYLWGPSALALLTAAARSGADGVPIRFVQIGSAGGAEIALPAAVLRSSSIEMLGSGLGSIGIERLVASVGGVLAAATAAGLTLDYRAVPLAEVEAAWHDERDQRIVFVTAR